MPQSTPLPLVALNPYVLVGNRHAGGGVGIPASKDSPSLILVFGFMDAPPKLIQKYVDGFDSLFPTAEIVFVKSFSSFFFTRRGYCEKMLLPVVELLRAHVEGRKTSAGILVHVFSNGGGFNYMLFHALLSGSSSSHSPSLSSTSVNTPIPIPTALILDSSPGNGGAASLIAFLAPARGLGRLLAVPSITLGHALLSSITALKGDPPLFLQMRSTLLSPSVLPGVGVGVSHTDPDADTNAKTKTSTSTPRMYIYSNADRVASPLEIQRHIDAARRTGFDVDVEVYEDTKHVGHAVMYGERYWGSIKRFWRRAYEKTNVRAKL